MLPLWIWERSCRIGYGHLNFGAAANYRSVNLECFYYHPYTMCKFTSSKEAGMKLFLKIRYISRPKYAEGSKVVAFLWQVFALPFKRKKKEYLRQMFTTTTTKSFLKYPLCRKNYDGKFPASFSVHPHSLSVQQISSVSVETQAWVHQHLKMTPEASPKKCH